MALGLPDHGRHLSADRPGENAGLRLVDFVDAVSQLDGITPVDCRPDALCSITQSCDFFRGIILVTIHYGIAGWPRAGLHQLDAGIEPVKRFLIVNFVNSMRPIAIVVIEFVEIKTKSSPKMFKNIKKINFGYFRLCCPYVILGDECCRRARSERRVIIRGVLKTFSSPRRVQGHCFNNIFENI